jgi:hypothetical protein
VTASQGQIAQTGIGSTTITGSYSITSEGVPMAGQVVQKVGRTTGRSEGRISSTCVNVNVSGSRVTQLCQSLVPATVGAGDSGSPVFRIVSGNSVSLYGILWGGGGGSYVFSPIANIQRSDELGDLTTCVSGC